MECAHVSKPTSLSLIFVAFLLSVFLLLTLSVPVFASTEIVVEGSYPFVDGSSIVDSSSYADGVVVFARSSNRQQIRVWSASSSSIRVAVQAMYSDAFSGARLVFASPYSGQTARYGTGDGSGLGFDVNLTYFDEATGWYYGSVGSYNTQTPLTYYDYSVFSSSSSTLDIVSYLASYVPESEPFDFSYSLPPGNALYVKLPSSGSALAGFGFSLRTTMPVSSYALNLSNGSPWDSTQTYDIVDSLPSSGSAVPAGTLVPWAKDGNLTILGVTQSAVYAPLGPYNQAGQYLVIVNPLYYGATANGPYEFQMNGPVQVDVSNAVAVYVYDLSSQVLTNASGGLDVTVSFGDTSAEGAVDPDTGLVTWTDTVTGDAVDPSSGGGNLIPQASTLKEFLQNFANTITGFFEQAFGSIRTLARSASSFVGEFSSLYSWLPPPVYSVLISALVIVLTVGVLKVFLR